MRLLRLAAWTLWFTLSWVAFAHAGFIAPIIGAIGSFLGGLGVVGQFIVGIALKVGLGLLQKALQKKPKEPALQADITVGGDNPLSFVMGAFATAGQLEYVNTWGNVDKTPNAYITHVISLSDLPLHALTGLWVNDQKVTLPTMTGSPPTAQGWPVAEFAEDGKDYLWIKFYDGSQTAADSFLTSTFGSDPDRPWQSDQIGRGVAYVIVTARRNDKLFSGIPSCLFETDGIPLYDIRKDSTAGGSGSHRWNNPATWEVSNNPVVHVYNIIRGVRYAGEWVYGGQTIDAYQLPPANWMAAANASDEAINLASGGTEPRYRAGCQVTVDQPPADVVESILKGCSGRLAEVGGAFKITVGAPGAAVYSFTDEQIIVTEAQSFDPFPGLESTYNGAQASYPEPVEKWASKDAPAYLRADLEVLDDNRRLVTGLTFPTVPYAVQVQRLLKEAVEDARRFRQHQFYLPPEAQVLEPGDVVAWTSARNSYSDKKFLVVEVGDQPNLLALVTLKEIDPSDYAWNPLTDEKAYSVGFVGPIRPPVQQMTGWQVFPATLTDENGNDRRPSIGVRFDGDLDDVRGVRVQVRVAATGEVQFDGTLPYGDPATNANPREIILNGTFLPDTNYEVRGIYVPYSGRLVDWSAWLPVKTDNIRLGDNDVYLPGMVADINQHTAEMLAPLNVSIRDLVIEANKVAREALDQDAGQYLNKEQQVSSLRSVFGTVTADYKSVVDAQTGPGSSIVRRLDTFDAVIPTLATASALNATIARVSDLEGVTTAQAAQINTLNAALPGKADVSALNSVSATVTSQGNTITAQGTAINGLQSVVGGYSSSALLRLATVATEAGASSTVGLTVGASGTGATATAALLMSAIAGGKSMIGLVADLVYMTDGAGNKAYPFVFSGGVMRANFANIGTVTAGVIQSPDSKFVITLASGKMEWFD